MIDDATVLGIEVVKARVSQTFLTYYDVYSAVVAEQDDTMSRNPSMFS